MTQRPQEKLTWTQELMKGIQRVAEPVDINVEIAKRQIRFDATRQLYTSAQEFIDLPVIMERQLTTVATDERAGFLPLLPTTIRAIRFSDEVVIGRNELNVNGNPEYDDSNVISIEDILKYEADIVNKTFRWPIVTPTTVSDQT